MSTDAYLHTSILYGQWEGWDGKPLDEPPLFYNGLTEAAANLLSSVSDEIVNIGRALELKTEADMSNVRDILIFCLIFWGYYNRCKYIIEEFEPLYLYCQLW